MSKIKSLLFGACDPNSNCAQTAYAIFRVVTGGLMATHGFANKLPPEEGFVGFLGKLNIPMPEISAWMAGLAEGVGGILIAIGLLTRPSALAVAITMSVAAFMAHGDSLLKDGEKAVFYLAAMIVIMGFGSGKFGIDRALRGS